MEQLKALVLKAEAMNRILMAKAMTTQSKYTTVLRCWVLGKYLESFEKKMRVIGSEVILIIEPQRRSKKHAPIKRILQVK